MSTIRVYELAKEVNKTNKEVLDFLKSKNIELTSHMSNVDETHANMVRDNYKKGNKNAQEGNSSVKQENGEKPKKKIIQVFRPQNASHTSEKKQKPQEHRSEENRGTQDLKQENRNNNRPNNNRYKENGEGRQGNRNSNGGENRSNNRFNKNNGENRPNNRGGNGENRQNRPNNRFNGNGESRPNNRNNGENRPNNNRYNGNNNQEGRSNNRFNGNGENRQGNRFNNNNGNGERSGNRFGNNQGERGNGRFGGRNDGRGNDNRREQSSKFDAPKLEFVEKDSRKANRENKKKDNRRDEYQNQGKRPNQGGCRQTQKIPKAMQLQKPVSHPKEEKKEEVKEITLPEKMTIRELAEKMKMQPSVIVKKLFLEGVMVTVNHEIDFEKAQEIALDYDIIAEQEEKVDVIEELLKEEEEDAATLVSRPPVVCVMGHVDHGKTSLLDCIRKTHVTDREAGGITQHIGAYMVSVDGQKITFLDTPGHEAFTAMRMRGANATDIAILVVAADDGVMPQTVEAINHAKAAGVEIIVAINKIDKPSANIERVKQELSEYELIPEDWGGSTIFVPVSAHTGEGIDNLLEMILLTAEVAELKANPNRRARGLVIEAELDKGKGPVATILVQKGTLRVGDFIAAGACSGKVRAMIDDKGRKVKEAGPSTPVEILGLSDVPNAGEILVVTENDKEAKNFAATFVSENKNRLLEETKAKMSLDDLFSQIQAGNLKELPLIVKADVQGSVEAVKQSLVKLSNEEVVVKVIHGGVGAINESDVTLASASNAIIIGFNVRPDATAKSVAEQEGVDLRLYRVIYQAIEDVEAAMKGMLDPVFEEKVIGHAEVRQIFKASGVGNIAGSYVLDGIFQRNCKVRISREGEQIFEGELASLKRFKDDVKEVKAGYECGLVFEDFNDIKEEDRVEAYIMVEVPR
ncbi:translation initiation factor IF-2 [Blautia sp. Marseille-P3201T]|uniref:translation initiation factor IF-2 n=1 Tax=Blautia sp. Marseille-P3201T TaxID=1907659 RepID=UPI00093152C0|nr:translation initiation factor IF-2 [Blautia sp. Marseille-P3201T]